MQYGDPRPTDDKLNAVSPPRSTTGNESANDRQTRGASHSTLLREIQTRIKTDNLRMRSSTSKLTEVYVAEMQKLHRLRREIDDLIPLICEANLVFRLKADSLVKEARDEILDAKRAEMVQRANLRIRPAHNIVDAHLLALSPETASTQLIDSLENNIQRFVSDFFAGLNRLVDQEVAGRVTWTSQNTCCYYFFRDVVIQESNTITKEVGRLHRSKHCPDGWEAAEDTNLCSVHVHRVARHEHHTTDAFHTTISDSGVVMPRAVREFVDRIPDWLAPIVRIIDGKIAREIIVERDSETEHWEQTTETRDIPVFGNEPAVVIDEVVLTGWGPREIEKELSRREPLPPTKQANSRASLNVLALVYFAIATAVCSVSFFFFANAAGRLPAIGVGVVIALLSAPISFAGFSLQSLNKTHGTQSRLWMLSSGVSAACIGIGLFAAYEAPSPAVSLFGIALLLTAAGLVALPPLLAKN